MTGPGRARATRGSGIGRAGAAPAPRRGGDAAGDDAAARLADLEELEEHYRRAPIGLCVVDRELRYTRTNDAYAEIVGLAPADLIGRSMYEVIPASARDAAVAAAARVVETGEPCHDLELERRVPEGSEHERFWLVNIQPVRRESEIVGAMAAIQNVTAVRRAEREARERLAEIESIYRNAPVGLSFVDADLRYQRVNQVIADMNGRTIEEVVGRTYRDLSPDSADAAEPFLRALMARGESVRNLEVVSRPPADPETDHLYLFSLEPVRNTRGEIVGHTSAVQDVTDLRRAEQAAARRLAELETLYDATPVGLCHADPVLRVVHLNPLFARLCRRPIDRLAGARVAEVLPEKIAAQLMPQLEYVVRSGCASASLEVSGPVPGSGRHEYTWIAHTHPTRSPSGALTGVVTVLQDVTALTDRRREIEEVADRLAEAQHVARVGSFEWDLISDGVWWSREMYEIAGKPASFMPSYDGFFELVHREDREKLRGQVEATVRDGEPARTTFRVVRPDGSVRLIFGVARLDRTEGGAPARMVGTWQDVTDYVPPRRDRRRRENRRSG